MRGLKYTDRKIIETLRNGGVGVVPTDTIYGIVGSALSKNAVRNIYRLRKRNSKKPMIVLIGSMKDLLGFGIKPSVPARRQIKKLWPGKVSIIFPCTLTKFSYLHRGTKTVAFRLPANANFRKFLEETGPLVAPSANIEGKPCAQTIAQAKKYFGNGVDFYRDKGTLSSKPSMLVKIQSRGAIKVMRA